LETRSITEIKFTNPFRDKWFSFIEQEDRIIIPKDFKPKKGKKYSCYLEHTEKVYIFKNKKYKLTIARKMKTEDLNEKIPSGDTTMAMALRKAGVLKHFGIK